jgi:hypothetical protein
MNSDDVLKTVFISDRLDFVLLFSQFTPVRS